MSGSGGKDGLERSAGSRSYQTSVKRPGKKWRFSHGSDCEKETNKTDPKAFCK